MTSDRRMETRGRYQADSPIRNCWYVKNRSDYRTTTGIVFLSFFLTLPSYDRRTFTPLCRSSTSRRSTLKRPWKAVCCMEEISTLLSTGFVWISKMVGWLISPLHDIFYVVMLSACLCVQLCSIPVAQTAPIINVLVIILGPWCLLCSPCIGFISEYLRKRKRILLLLVLIQNVPWLLLRRCPSC